VVETPQNMIEFSPAEIHACGCRNAVQVIHTPPTLQSSCIDHVASCRLPILQVLLLPIFHARHQHHRLRHPNHGALLQA